ncbi:hypothetical protein BC829DRAFT_424169, partial [Chytridium lagenaria]
TVLHQKGAAMMGGAMMGGAMMVTAMMGAAMMGTQSLTSTATPIPKQPLQIPRNAKLLPKEEKAKVLIPVYNEYAVSKSKRIKNQKGEAKKNEPKQSPTKPVAKDSSSKAKRPNEIGVNDPIEVLHHYAKMVAIPHYSKMSRPELWAGYA